MNCATAQNLVPNPSFETYDTCPNIYSKVEYAVPWYNPGTATPDYLNSCNWGAYGVPDNAWGYQHARTGNAYTGVYVYGSPYREYIQVELTDSLIESRQYCVSFYVNLVYDNSYRLAITQIGLLFSDTAILASNMNCLQYTPQVASPPNVFLTDTANWMLVSGMYTAHGGEKFITIGNFKDDIFTDTLDYGHMSNIRQSYYNIDDVSVEDCLSGIAETNNSRESIAYPNPFTQSTTLHFENPGREICTLRLYDNQGRLVQTINNISTDHAEISRKDLQNGLYYYCFEQIPVSSLPAK